MIHNHSVFTNGGSSKAKDAPPQATFLHLSNILTQLRGNSINGEGTDLEVLCPQPFLKVGEKKVLAKEYLHRKYKTFHIHSCIVSVCSDYFRTFPTPLKGRTIDEINSDIFEICLDFMYLGEFCVSKELTDINVASVLAASQLLGIHTLTSKCFDFLEEYLDHSNYKVVQQLASQFHNAALFHKASRFSFPSIARDHIANEKRRLCLDFSAKEQALKQAKVMKESCENTLQQMNEKWNDIIEKELAMCVRKMEQERNASGTERHNELTSPSYPSIHHKDAGAVGRLVFNDLSFVGNNVYSHHHLKKSTDSTILKKKIFKQLNDGSEACTCHSKPPPPPTTEQYEKYGILYSYSSLEDALDFAEPGDRIYLMPGQYRDLQSNVVDKSLEIIGFGESVEDVVLFSSHCEDGSIFRVSRGYVRITNVTFRSYRAFVVNENGSCYYEVNEHNRPLCKLEKTGELFLEKCTFTHDTNCKSKCQDTSRVNGLYIEGGRRAIIKNCTFRGGHGSAIIVLNDQSTLLAHIYLFQNIFINIGQPSSSLKGFLSRISGPLKPVPIPAAVELWKLHRRSHRHIKTNIATETYKRVKVYFKNNQFSYNGGTGLAYRFIIDDNFIRENQQIYNSRTYDNDHEIPEVCMHYLTHDSKEETKQQKDSKRDWIKKEFEGYTLNMKGNVMEKNGFGISCKDTSHWKWFDYDLPITDDETIHIADQNRNDVFNDNCNKTSHDEEQNSPPKKSRLGNLSMGIENIEKNENKQQEKAFLVPDGESIMVAHQLLSQDHHNFFNTDGPDGPLYDTSSSDDSHESHDMVDIFTTYADCTSHDF